MVIGTPKKVGFNYTTVHCVKCHSICILEYPRYAHIGRNPMYYESLCFMVLEELKDWQDSVKRKINRILGRRTQWWKPDHWDRDWDDRGSCRHMEGICERCIKKEKTTSMLSENNVIDEYREILAQMSKKCKNLYFEEETQLIKTLSGKVLYEINKAVFKKYCIGNHSKDIAEKRKLAEEYVTEAKEDIIKCLKCRVLNNEALLQLRRRALELRPQVMQLIKNGEAEIRKYRKITKNDGHIIKTKHFPFLPHEAVSDCKMYIIAEKYNKRKLMKQTSSDSNDDIFRSIQGRFQHTLKCFTQKMVHLNWRYEGGYYNDNV